MKRRGKVVALWAATVGIVVLVATAILAKDRIQEEWYLRQLEHGIPAQRESAARRLSELKSVKAIPHLLALLRQGADARQASDDHDTTNMFCMHALQRIGKAALPSVIKAYGDEVARNRSGRSLTTFEVRLTRTLWKLCGVRDRAWGNSYEREFTTDVLRNAALNVEQSTEVRQAADEVLKELQGKQNEAPR